MTRLSKSQLLHVVGDAIRESGWNFLYLTSQGNHPARYQIYRNGRTYRIRVYIWNLTPGGRNRPADEWRIQVTGLARFEPEKGHGDCPSRRPEAPLRRRLNQAGIERDQLPRPCPDCLRPSLRHVRSTASAIGRCAYPACRMSRQHGRHRQRRGLVYVTPPCLRQGLRCLWS